MSDREHKHKNPYRISSQRLSLHARLLLSNPSAFLDRLINAAEGRLGQRLDKLSFEPGISFERAVARLEQALNKPIGVYLAEDALQEIENGVELREAALANNAPFPIAYSADLSLARLAYLLCRAMRPEVVVEVGVAYGKSSAYILQALAVNTTGELHSIDLPALIPHLDAYLGCFVPDNLHAHWHRYEGSSRRHLLELLKKVDRVPLAVLDGLHTKKNILRELNMLKPFVSTKSVLIIDDVHRNSAFNDWTSGADLRDNFSVQEDKKENLFGIAVFNTDPIGQSGRIDASKDH